MPPKLADLAYAPIETERLHLRLAGPTDVEDYLEIFARPEVCRYLMHDALDRDGVIARLARFRDITALRAVGEALRIAVVRRTDQRVIGELVLIAHAVSAATLEIGWVLSPDVQGHGYAAEGAAALLAYAMTKLDAHRVIAQLHPDNTDSAALCRRLGMRQEAHHLRDVWVKGTWEDTAIFAILDEEWQQAQSAQGSHSDSEQE